MTHPEPTPDPNPLCGADPLARALARLRPAPSGVDANRLLFEAGQAARDRSVAFWRRAVLGQFVLLAAVGCLAVVHFVRLDAVDRQADSPQVVERIVYVNRPVPVPMEPEEAPPPRVAPEPIYPVGGPFAGGSDADALGEYLRIRRDVLTAGLGLLPDAKARPATPASADELERLLNLPRGVLTAPQWRPRKPAPEPPDQP